MGGGHSCRQGMAAIPTHEQCALITFSTEAHCLQIGEQSLFPLDGPEGERDRGRLLDSLNRIVPEGGTNTLAALRMAYEIEGVDTILLFTDGEPNDGKSRGFDPENAAMIHELCRGKRGNSCEHRRGGGLFKARVVRFLAASCGGDRWDVYRTLRNGSLRVVVVATIGGLQAGAMRCALALTRLAWQDASVLRRFRRRWLIRASTPAKMALRREDALARACQHAFSYDRSPVPVRRYQGCSQRPFIIGGGGSGWTITCVGSSSWRGF